MSASDASAKEALSPAFVNPTNDTAEKESTSQVISTLQLQKHPEGGYFVETDRDPFEVSNPFVHLSDVINSKSNTTRNASTSIFYYLTPSSPQGNFHRNAGRTIHTLHKGRGRYVLIHADEVRVGGKAKVESFIVGHDITKGERLQWIVEGGKYKASFLLPDTDGGDDSEGLLISETVVPGFDFRDHDFLEADHLAQLVTPDKSGELQWLLRSGFG